MALPARHHGLRLQRRRVLRASATGGRRATRLAAGAGQALPQHVRHCGRTWPRAHRRPRGTLPAVRIGDASASNAPTSNNRSRPPPSQPVSPHRSGRRTRPRNSVTGNPTCLRRLIAGLQPPSSQLTEADHHRPSSRFRLLLNSVARFGRPGRVVPCQEHALGSKPPTPPARARPALPVLANGRGRAESAPSGTMQMS
jgi:hypothetical protein